MSLWWLCNTHAILFYQHVECEVGLMDNLVDIVGSLVNLLMKLLVKIMPYLTISDEILWFMRG